MKSLYIYLTFLVFATRKLEISALSEESQAFLDGHNSMRLKVAKGEVPGQPGAAEMKAMVWDDELFKKASEYIATFPQAHNTDKTVPSGRFTTGENLYWYSSPDRDYKVNPNDALKAWFDENKDYKFGPIQMSDFTGPKSIGHYTQMVWSESIYLGCATSNKWDGQFNQIYVICNYGPAGNMLGEPPYKEGSSDKLIEAAAAA